ncbi:SDR family NAD(P)-dependent oxidoreductase [Solwaraspora sp. WMMB335]|uniref:SDR family NAD(P)-dependent oxidoreductase n=1 Tax=Solwaraspora sp. WMMB335 TaxID=3404118 RepID=UPI003B96692A
MADPAAGPLAGRVAVVTGGGQGLGRAFAHRLAADGARVAVADRNADAAATVAAEISSAAGGTAVAVPVDVADEVSVAAMTGQVVDAYGGIDVLVNNAAVFSTLAMRPFDEIDPAEWDRVMAVNVRGPFLCARAAAPVMRHAGYGKIVNISSATVWIGRPHYLHYVTSKAALIGMTRALATELGPAGIRVNAVTPGATRTEIPRATVTPEQERAIVAGQAIKRRQVPGDLVGVVAFLAGADSDFMTGQTVNVDGGAAFH